MLDKVFQCITDLQLDPDYYFDKVPMLYNTNIKN